MNATAAALQVEATSHREASHRETSLSLVEREGALDWVRICPLDQLPMERGVAALVNGHQVALFRLHDGTVAAVGNRDPFSGANVMSRGLVGSRGDVPVVFSPMYKQAFSLLDGACLTEPAAGLGHFTVRLSDGWVELGLG